MIDGTDPETGKLSGRTQAHAPEVDGLVLIESTRAVMPGSLPRAGDIVDVRISAALDYDLIGENIHG
jgi:tRNA A37 methylthiotransferase MiaB